MQQRTYASHVTPGLVAHYWRMVPVLEAIFGQIPIVGSSYPQGFGHQECWHQGLANVPPSVATAVLHAREGPRTYLALEQRAVQWALHALGFVELFSWSPCTSDSSRLAFARILLRPPKADSPSAGRVQAAARIVRTELMRRGLDAIVLFDGRRGMALWIPFDDAPAYDPVRAWLHRIADALAAAHPNLLTTKPNSDRSDLVHVHVDKNSPGSFSSLPYSVRAQADLPVCYPATWDEIEARANGEVTATSLPERLTRAGEVFAAERRRIGAQHFAGMLGA